MITHMYMFDNLCWSQYLMPSGIVMYYFEIVWPLQSHNSLKPNGNVYVHLDVPMEMGMGAEAGVTFHHGIFMKEESDSCVRGIKSIVCAILHIPRPFWIQNEAWNANRISWHRHLICTFSLHMIELNLLKCAYYYIKTEILRLRLVPCCWTRWLEEQPLHLSQPRKADLGSRKRAGTLLSMNKLNIKQILHFSANEWIAS